MGAFQGGSVAQWEGRQKRHEEQKLGACGWDSSTNKGDRKVGQSTGWGMLFPAVAADPTLSKHGRRGEQRRAEGQGAMVEGRGRWNTGCVNGCFLSLFLLLFSPSFLTRSLNFSPGGRGPSAPALLRAGGVGDLSPGIKDPIG